jgi:hypothetical protein
VSQALADGTDPSRFRVYARLVLMVCEACDTNVFPAQEDPLLLDLTDAARTHVCDPVKVAAVSALLDRNEASRKT